MDPDHGRPPRVPRPRESGGDTGGAWYPAVPAPRGAPALERIRTRVATLADRPVGTPAAPATTLVPVARRCAAVAVPQTALPGVLCSWGRAVARLVHAAVDGVGSLVRALVPAPVSR